MRDPVLGHRELRFGSLALEYRTLDEMGPDERNTKLQILIMHLEGFVLMKKKNNQKYFSGFIHSGETVIVITSPIAIRNTQVFISKISALAICLVWSNSKLNNLNKTHAFM